MRTGLFGIILISFILSFSSIESLGAKSKENKGELIERINQAKKDYGTKLTELNEKNKELRREIDEKKKKKRQEIEEEKVGLQKSSDTYSFFGLFQEKKESGDELDTVKKGLSVEDKLKIKELNAEYKSYSKALDKEIAAAYKITEKEKVKLRKELYKTRQELEAKLKEVDDKIHKYKNNF